MALKQNTYKNFFLFKLDSLCVTHVKLHFLSCKPNLKAHVLAASRSEVDFTPFKQQRLLNSSVPQPTYGLLFFAI